MLLRTFVAGAFVLASVTARADAPAAPVTTPAAAPEPVPTVGPQPEPVPEPAAPVHEDLHRPLLAPQDPGPDARPWAVLIQGGLQFVLLEGSPLGRQLRAAGYSTDALGPTFGVQVQRFVLDWLVVGGGLDLRHSSGDRANDSFSGSLAPNDSSELWRVAGMVYVQPTMCLQYGSCRRDGAYFGFQLGVGAGPTWWVLRGHADAAVHVRLEAALIWEADIDDVFLGFRLAHALVWQAGLGPRDLGHPFTWLPATEIRLGYRW